MNDIENILREAESAMNAGNGRKVLPLLLSLVEKQVPEAMYLASCVSKPRETSEAFEQRRFWLLNQAARLNHAQSIYTLGVHYAFGDVVMKSEEIASVHFEKAAILGHSRAKLSYGMDLVRGINRIPKDKERGVDYIRQAIAENVEDADKILDQILAGKWD